VPFVLLLAITIDLLGVAVVASREAFVNVRPGGTVLLLAALAVAFGLRRWRVRSFWPYLLISGPLSWWALYLDGLHPAFALMPIVPFMRHSPRSLELFEDAPHGKHDSPTHLEHVFKYPVHAVLFLFGLVNAGVLLNGYGTGTWALLTATMIGKPLGIIGGVALALALGLHMPRGLHWRDVVVVALATCGGFAFALFFATAVFPIGPLLGELKIGAIVSGIGVPIAYGVAWMLRAGRFASHRA
jgi:NhaA family Na+:H+ antiporter